jgi:hypothetical protein
MECQRYTVLYGWSFGSHGLDIPFRHGFDHMDEEIHFPISKTRAQVNLILKNDFKKKNKYNVA